MDNQLLASQMFHWWKLYWVAVSKFYRKNVKENEKRKNRLWYGTANLKNLGAKLYMNQFSFWEFLAFVSSYWLDGPHPMPFVGSKHQPVMQKMTRSSVNQKQNQCASMFLLGAERLHSSSPQLGLIGSQSPSIPPCCSLQDHFCGFPEQSDNHRGKTIFGSWNQIGSY